MMHWLRYFGLRALRNIREEWALNLRVVTGFALMLVIAGVFLLVARNMGLIIERWGEQLQITAYVKKGTPEERARELSAILEKLPEVESSTLVTEAQALQRFRQDLSGFSGMLDGLTENPLPASIEIRLTPEARTGDKIAGIAHEIGGLEGIDEVQYGQEWIERYRVFLELVTFLGAGVGTVLLFVGWGSISNLIQLTVFARKDEIQILKLVGATDRFVRAPFLIEGFVQGLAASILSLGLLWLLYQTTLGSLGQALGGLFGQVEPVFLSSGQIAALMAGSVALALLASFSATGRHLGV